MSKPIRSGPGRGRRLDLRLAAMIGVVLLAVSGLLQLPSGATAGVTSGIDDRAASPIASPVAFPVASSVAPPVAPPPPAPNHKALGTYQLRCWQYGRLLFDEGPVTLGPEARQGAKVVAIDRNGRALIVTHAGETLCQARPFPPAPNLALPR